MSTRLAKISSGSPPGKSTRINFTVCAGFLSNVLSLLLRLCHFLILQHTYSDSDSDFRNYFTQSEQRLKVDDLIDLNIFRRIGM